MAAAQHNIAKTPSDTNTPRAVFGNSPETLAQIYRSDVHLAVWQRQKAPCLPNEWQHRNGGKAISQRTTLSAANMQNLAEAVPVLAPYPELSEDIGLLADMFSYLFELTAIGLRIATLTQPMCPKFHVDRVPCRLITTYVGPGSQWLPHHCTDRSKLGAGSAGLSDAESGLYPTKDAIQTLAAGDVALLKGESWEGNEGAGLVHRSPAVKSGQQRLLLTLDFAVAND